MVENEFRETMRNVMAACHSYRVSYSPDYKRLNPQMTDAEMNERVGNPDDYHMDRVINFRNKQEQETFEEGLRTFVTYQPQTKKGKFGRGMHGVAWKPETDETVIILMTRMYQYADEELDEYAKLCNVDTFEEAAKVYGPLRVPSLYGMFRVSKKNLDRFVEVAAPYCWMGGAF